MQCETISFLAKFSLLLYDVSAAPRFFILDKEKRIIVKPYGVKELKEFYLEK